MAEGLGSDLYILGVIVALTVSSFLTRACYFMFGGRLPLSEPTRRALRYAPTAALMGIVVPELLPWEPGVGPVLDIRLIAGIAGVLLFLRTGSSVLLIVGGMVVLWGLQAWM